jgi:hypothetical protein
VTLTATGQGGSDAATGNVNCVKRSCTASGSGQ